MRKLITYANRTIPRRAAATVAPWAPAMGVNQAMKTMSGLLLAGMILLFCSSIGNGQIIYSNAFNGPAKSVNVLPVTMSTNYAGGTSSAWWTVLSSSATNYLYQNGTIGTGLNSTLLPFTPEDGYVYTLTASVTVPTMVAGKWITMGFAENNPPINTASDPRFGGVYVKGHPWTYLTEGTGGDVFFPVYGSTNGDANAQLMPTPGTYTVQLKLDTTGSQWKSSEFVNGIQVGTTYTYNPNPTITAVGVGQTTLTSSSGIQWNYLTLSAAGTRSTNTANATVSFSGTGSPLNPAFVGLSYEKLTLTTNFFTSTNVSLVNLFSTIAGPAVLRIGGGTVDATGWNGISNTIPITSSQVDRLAGFINALPGNWSVIYGIDLLHNTAANATAEATYVHNAVGSRLLGFEIGNEPEFYYTYSTFLSRWRTVAANIITDSYPLVGADAGQGQLSAFTDTFANDESGVASLLTQHYYRLAGGSPTNTMQNMLLADGELPTLSVNISEAAYSGNEPLGARISECGSCSAGGTLEMSDVYGAALWSLDFMGTAALNNVQGINFHGGGRSPYSPLQDNSSIVTAVGPEFYGLEMFSLIPSGNPVPATVTGASGINFTAYGKKCAGGGTCALLVNKEVNTAVSATVNLGSGVSSVSLVSLTSPNLYCTSDYTLGGSSIYTDGTWTGGVESVLSASNGQLTVSVPPISAYLLIPSAWQPLMGALSGQMRDAYKFNVNDGSWLIRSGADGTTNAVSWGTHGDVPLIGNWAGNGMVDEVVWRPSTTEWYVMNGTNGAEIDQFHSGLAGDTPLIGAWSTGQMWDTATFRPSNGNWYLRFHDGSTTWFHFGTNGDVPLIGDWIGNGMVDEVVWRPSTAEWYVQNGTNNTEIGQFQSGLAGDIPLIGAWSTGQMWDTATFRPSNGTWYLRYHDESTTWFQFGTNGDIPMVGDYYGNGMVDELLYRPSNNTWYVRNGLNGQTTSFSF